MWTNLGSNADSANIENLDGILVPLPKLSYHVRLRHLQGWYRIKSEVAWNQVRGGKKSDPAVALALSDFTTSL